MRFIVPTILLISCSGCASTMMSDLGSIPAAPAGNILLIDVRAEEDKLYFRKSIADYQKLGDANFNPPIMDYFKHQLERRASETHASYKVEVTQFRVVDVFPARWQAAQAAAMTGARQGALQSLGFRTAALAVYKPPVQKTAKTDYVVVIFTGRINGKEMAYESIMPYAASPYSLNTFNDASFKAAVSGAITDVTKNILP